MRFLIDANMPRSAAELLKRYNHEAMDVRDIGMGAAADSDIAIYAQQNGLAVVTRDFDFADIRNYPPFQYSGLLVLALPEDAVATFVVQVLESFLANKELIEALPGRLAIVEPARVRLRPPVSRSTILPPLALDRAMLARVGGLHMTARRNLKNSRTGSFSRLV